MSAGVGVGEVIVEGPGIAGSPNGGIITVQGDAAGTAIPVTATVSGTISADVTDRAGRLVGVVTVSGTVAVTQSGAWSVAATQSGAWTVAATQSGAWSVTVTGTPTVDVTDRAARLLGVIASIAAPVAATQSGAWSVSVTGTPTVDVTDRVGRALGVVASITAAVDVSDRVGRALGVVASITAAVDVSDRAARLVGVVDTELPAAAALGDAIANPTTPTVGAMASIWDPTAVTWSRWRQAFADAATVGIGMVAPMMWNGTNSDRWPGNTTAGGRVNLQRATVTVEGKSAANTTQTITLAAPGANNFHWITSIQITRSATAALAGTATLDYTSTNLGAWRVTVGNAMIAGGTQLDFGHDYAHPKRSAAANTASTIVAPAGGAAVITQIVVEYYIGPA